MLQHSFYTDTDFVRKMAKSLQVSILIYLYYLQAINKNNLQRHLKVVRKMGIVLVRPVATRQGRMPLN